MKDHDKHPVLGIDLGTTYSAIARWDGRGPRTYENKMGEDITQSVVYYDDAKGTHVVGSRAYKLGLMTPENMAFGVKRQMARGATPLPIGKKHRTPVQVSADILRRLVADVAEKTPGFRSRGAVVTVPYYFKNNENEYTRQAAELAEIDCLQVLPEPIAASLSYAWLLAQDHPEREIHESILIFDLGGGTFDLTLFRLALTPTALRFEVLATGGDDRLGGMDFDRSLALIALDKFLNAGVDGSDTREQLESLRATISEDRLADIVATLPPALAGDTARVAEIAQNVTLKRAGINLIAAAREAKHWLTENQEIDVIVPHLLPGVHLEAVVTREEFEEALVPYVEKIETLLDKIWAAANIRPHRIDRVLRVGGSSAIPRMKRLLEETIGSEKIWGAQQPLLCVAEGAAMYAAFIDDPSIFGRTIDIVTATCHPLGIAQSGGSFDMLIPANRKTPCSVTKHYTNTRSDMTDLRIPVYQGSSPVASKNTRVGTVVIKDLPPRPANSLNIEVTFELSLEQRLTVTVVVDGKTVQHAWDIS